MPKARTAKSDWCTIAHAAKELGLPHETIRQAVLRGEIMSSQMVQGIKIISLTSARHFANNRPKRGRPKA